MNHENDIKPGFQADSVDFTNEGLVFICVDEAEAQRAYCEALLVGHTATIDGRRLVLTKFGKQESDRNSNEWRSRSNQIKN